MGEYILLSPVGESVRPLMVEDRAEKVCDN